MPNCANDLTPVITQVALAMPILIGILATWLNLKIAQQKQRAGHDVVSSKIDALTTITVNGFHAPPQTPVTVVELPAKNVDNSQS